MFRYNDAFNQNIGEWDVSNVITMSGMFAHTELFNQNISLWDVSNVRSMNEMFFLAKAFNQNLSDWCIPNIKEEPPFFASGSSFNSKFYPNWGCGQMTSINDEVNNELPHRTMLKQNYPNPFNPTTTIEYALKDASEVVLEVFNLSGKRISTLVQSSQSAGEYSISFNALNLPSGLYVYRLTTDVLVQTRKMLLVK